jgi:hypothetical protein
MWLLAANALAASLLLVGCDKGHHIRYENQTDQTVDVYIGNTREVTLASGEARSFTTVKLLKPATFQAKTSDGEVIFSRTLSWDDLRSMDWTIVIAADQSSHLPSTPVTCATPFDLAPGTLYTCIKDVPK